MSDRPLSERVREELHEQSMECDGSITDPYLTPERAALADEIAALEAKCERLERLIESWEFDGFAGSSELANEVRAALEGREP